MCYCSYGQHPLFLGDGARSGKTRAESAERPTTAIGGLAAFKGEGSGSIRSARHYLK